MKFSIILLWGAIKIEWTRDAAKELKPTVEPAYKKMYRDDPKMCELLKGKV